MERRMKTIGIRDKIQKVIDKEKERLTRELDMYRKKMDDTEVYYGFGGPYRRQEMAYERREAQLEELEEFEDQLKKVTKHIEADVYVFGCKECRAVCMTTKEPFDDWHECPTCRKMIYLQNVPRQTIRIAGDGTDWQHILKKSLEEEKTWKEE